MTTTTQIAEYSATEAALATLREKYATTVFDVTTTKGMKEAREARRELVTYRTSLEAKRKELKAPLLERSRLLDSEAKRITEELLALEQPIDAVIKAEEERKAEEKRQAEEAERQRIAAIQDRINAIRSIPMTLTGRTAAAIAEQQVALGCLEINLEDYAELTGEAMQARAQVLEQLAALHTAALDHEAEQERIKAERAELEKLRAEQAERERLAAEEAARAEVRARTEREALEAEQRRVAEEQAAQQAELDRQRRELEEQQAAAERARQAEAEAKAKAERELAERKAREQFLQDGPTAEELVQLIAEHYQVEPDTVIGWLTRHRFEQLAAA